MPGRHRSQVFTRSRGEAQDLSSGYYYGGGSITSGYAEVDDWLGLGDCFPFGVSKWYYDGIVMNRIPSWSSIRITNMTPDAMWSDGLWPHGNVTGLHSNLTYAAKAAAQTNPSRPYVDVPVSLLELRDVAMLIRDTGRSIIQRAAANNIRYQFGIRPMVQDLVQLLRFQEQVDRRVNEMRKLAGPRGLRRTLNMDSSSVGVSTGNIYMHSVLSSSDSPVAVWTGRTSENVRAHVRWNAAFAPTVLNSPEEMRRLARNAVLGLTLDSSTLWEALPWSWLIDWCSTMGDYFKANRNIIPASLAGVYIMRHTQTEYSWGGTQFAYGEGYCSGGTINRVSKTRSASIPVLPIAHFPFLSGNQMGILGSLAVMRR